MLDPVVDFIEWVFDRIGRGIGWIIAALLWPFVAFTAWVRKRGFIIKSVVSLFVLLLVAGYAYYFYQTQFWNGYNKDYVASYKFNERTVAPGETIGETGKCETSAIIAVTADLTDFNVNQNSWVPSLLLSKTGLFGLDWKRTPWFDNKAAFQLGINNVVVRTTFEAVDRLGRVRGTSQIDQNLQSARQNFNYPEDRWYFSLSPFGFYSPTQSSYRQAIGNLEAFNARLSQCDALFDPRADNLLRFMDQMANTLGSTSDVLGGQMAASNAGWFDTRADDRFWFAYGQLYALEGMMAAVRADFSKVITEKGATRVFNQMQSQLRAALEIDPIIISNGAEDAFMFPSHLSTMGFNLLRVRANLTEIRDILDR